MPESFAGCNEPSLRMRDAAQPTHRNFRGAFAPLARRTPLPRSEATWGGVGGGGASACGSLRLRRKGPHPQPLPTTRRRVGGGELTELAAPLHSLARAGLFRRRHELGADGGAVLAERGHGAVAARHFPRAARGRAGIGDGARRRADLDAAQLRMARELGGGVDAGERDVGGRELCGQRRRVEARRTPPATRPSVCARR